MVRSEHYFAAAVERSRQANLLYLDGRSFALAIYVAGLSSECLLRAFKARHDETFDERHDMLRLLAASGLMDIDRQQLIDTGMIDSDIDIHLQQLKVAVHEICLLWSNRYRFAPEELLRSHLKRRTQYRKIKGDYLKAQARRLLDATDVLMRQGFLRWRLSGHR